MCVCVWGGGLVHTFIGDEELLTFPEHPKSFTQITEKSGNISVLLGEFWDN